MSQREIIAKVPPVFYWDHCGRDLPAGEVLKETNAYVLIALNQNEYSELLSDAEFHSDCASWAGNEYRGLQSSARAMVRALGKVGA
jgi:hypothetical protein